MSGQSENIGIVPGGFFDRLTSGDYIEWNVWVCPVHGVISEDELLEGHDGTMFGPHPGSDGYTGEFFCARDHDGENPPAVQHDIRSGPWGEKEK